MQIQLEPYDLTKRQNFRLLTALQKRKLRVFLWVIYFLVAAISIVLGWGYFNGIFFKLFSSWYPVVLLLIAWWLFLTYGQAVFVTMSKKNRHQFQSYEYSIDNDFLIMKRGDGANSRIPFSKIVKSYKVMDHYFLQENLVSAHIIPASAFKSEDDIKAFERQLEIVS